MSDWAVQTTGSDAIDAQVAAMLLRIKALEGTVAQLTQQLASLVTTGVTQKAFAPPTLPPQAGLVGDVLQAGRAGGQQVAGGVAPGEALTLLGTSSTTDGGTIQASAATQLWYTGATVAAQQERMRLTSTGLLGIGTSAPAGLLTLSDTGVNTLLALGYGMPPAAPSLYLRAARGTPATPLALAAGDLLMSLYADGYDGTAYRQGGAWQALAEGTPTVSGVPTGQRWSTSDGTGIPVERLRLTSAGRLGLGTTLPAGTLHVRAQATNATVVVDGFSDTQFAGLYIQRTHGSVAVPAAVANGDLSVINYSMYDGSAYFNSASIRAVIRGAVSTPGNIPCDLVFTTGWNAAAGVAEKVRFTGDGRFAYNLGTGVIPTATMQIKSIPQATTLPTVQVDGVAGQTAALVRLQSEVTSTNDLLQANHVNGLLQFRIYYGGAPLFRNANPPGNADMVNGEFSFYYSPTTNVLSCRGRDSTGTARTLAIGTLT